MPRGVSLCGCSVTRCVCAAVSLCSEALCRRHFFVRYLYCGYAAAGRERALVFAIKRRSRIIFLKNLKYLFPRKSLLRGFFVVWLGRGLQPAAFRQTSSANFLSFGWGADCSRQRSGKQAPRILVAWAGNAGLKVRAKTVTRSCTCRLAKEMPCKRAQNAPHHEPSGGATLRIRTLRYSKSAMN